MESVKSLDKAGKIFLGERDMIVIDGVPCVMDDLVRLVNPDPRKYYRAVRNDDTVTIVELNRAGVLAALIWEGEPGEVLNATQEQLDALAHGIAYDACCTVIESNCMRVLDPESTAFPFFDVSATGCDEPALEHVQEGVRYLEARGLIVRHKDNADWVQLQDESEATA